jgi:hypothetical protein
LDLPAEATLSALSTKGMKGSLRIRQIKTLFSLQGKEFIVTGQEKATLSNPRFLFVFTHRASGEVVKVNVANTSTSDRYDQCSIVVNNLFTDKTAGLWTYIVREKADQSTTETGNVVETGYMFLKDATDFEPEQYTEQSNDFTIYAGQ